MDHTTTRPQLIQLVPTMQKMLFTSSFLAKFMKIRFTNVAGTSSFFMCHQISFFTSVNQSQGHIWDRVAHYGPPLTPKKTWAKNSKQLTVENFGTETETECCSHPFTTKKPRNQRHILIFFELLLP